MIVKASRVASRAFERLRRAFAEFLTIPLIVVVIFFAIALAAHVADVDAGRAAHWGPVWRFLGRYVGDSASANSLLSAIASSLITVTSITFSILLLAVQQGASALTAQIIDHYLRRPSNQIYFGFFVGTSIYALVTLVLTTIHLRPVMGVTLATIFAGMALFALILLIYSTIDQIRPVTIINRIHDTTLCARQNQLAWLIRTAAVKAGVAQGQPVVSQTNGYLARVRVSRLEKILAALPGSVIEIRASIGDYIPCGATLAVLKTAQFVDAKTMHALCRALPIEEKRDIDCDAAFGIQQLSMIAWTSISTAKSNPASGIIACQALEDILCRWSGAEKAPTQASASSIFYADRAGEYLLDGLESLLAVSSESMQGMSLAAIMDGLSGAFAGMPQDWQDRVERMLLNSLSALGDHMPSRVLDASFVKAAMMLSESGREDGAAKISAAWKCLSESSGNIHSRGNRA